VVKSKVEGATICHVTDDAGNPVAQAQQCNKTFFNACF
jgi:hypothetical protein